MNPPAVTAIYIRPEVLIKFMSDIGKLLDNYAKFEAYLKEREQK